MSAEGPSPVKIYRYNIATGIIDLDVVPTDPVTGLQIPNDGVYNNLAVHSGTLYLGTDGSDLFAKANALDGTVFEVSEYESPACGSPSDLFEGGAYEEISKTLWRATTDNRLLRTTTDGTDGVCTPVSGGGFHLLGLEWIGNTLYATVLHDGLFGTISDPFEAPRFEPCLLTGIPGDHKYDGLAYDADDAVLYMATRSPLNRAFLWTVDPDGCEATLVVDLTTVGYPAGAASDSIGWIGCPWDLDGDGIVGIVDFLSLLASWGKDPGGPPDFDADGTVGITDFLALLQAWGPCP